MARDREPPMTKRLLLLAAVLAAANADAAPPKKKKPVKPAPATQPASQPAPATQQQDQPVIEIEPETQPAPTTPGTAAPPPPQPETAAEAAAPPPPVKAGDRLESWQDVVVVVRKPFLKAGRFELQPLFQVTLNDNMIRHYAPTAQLTYWLTDVLGVGVEGQYYTHFDTFLEAHDLVKEDYRRLPTLNEYKFGAALDFHYVPIYAKFAVWNKYMVHWEGMFTIGVGVTESSVLPRDPALPGWDNFNITPNVGFQLRVFLASWITFNISVKDYIFVDKFESVMRTADMTVDQAKDNATSQLINNIMFGVGVSLWLPPTFQYTTFR
jgi:outer membrane beta-barrel protein